MENDKNINHMQKLFQKNIKFLYDNLPHYYQLIKNIKNRNYIIKNNNIYDLDQNPIYPNSIETDSKLLASNPINNPLYKKNFLLLNPQKWEKDFYITGKIINKLINKFNTLPHTDGFYFDKNFLPATIIYGILGGKHIDLLVENYEFQSLLIYEPNPEFFAISLYFMDLEKIYSKLKERFFIQISGEITEEIIQKFFTERVVTSSFMQLELITYNHPLLSQAQKKIKEFSQANIRGWGTYEDEIKGIKNHKANINKYPLLKDKIKLDIPFCIVANGKSLEDKINFIKKNKDSMIIVSVGTSLKVLLNEGIESDFHIEQERTDFLEEALKDVFPKFNGYFLGANVVNPKVFQMAKNPLMYIREGFTYENFYPNPLIYSSPIVGNAGVSFAANFTKEIYLVGMDLGYKKGEKKHAKGSIYDNFEDKAENGIEIKGNFEKTILTDSLYLTSKYSIEKLIKYKNLKIYNLSNGAYINNTIPLKDKQLPKIDKNKYIKIILKAFTSEKYNENSINLSSIIKAISKSFHLPMNDYKQIIGLIDFLEDLMTDYIQKDEAAYKLLRGSIWHILFHFLILSHKLENKKDIKKLAKIIKKEIFLFEKDFANF